MIDYKFTITIHPSEELHDGDNFMDFADYLYESFDGDIEVMMEHGSLVLYIKQEAKNTFEGFSKLVDKVDQLRATYKNIQKQTEL